MSTTETITPDAESSAPPPEPAERRKSSARNGLQALAMRLHFYAGVFVAPFILIAAVTGALYAISPTLESFLSRDLLTVEAGETALPLAEQVTAAVATRPDLALAAVSPAPGPEDTTRVVFTDPSLGESERRAVFVNPYTAEPVGESVIYGSSQALPLRTWIDQLHRDLHLGEPGRLYSELAASWLWVIALAGLVLWFRRVRARRQRNSAAWLFAPDRSKGGRGRTMNWHGAIGVWILPLILLLSATGMTWSTYAGENITELRKQLSWTTPAVSTALPGSTAPDHSSGGDHHGGGHAHAPKPADPQARIAQVDRVYESARAAGITQAVEITIPATPEKAFAVKERRMPGTYSVDAVAVDGATGSITDRLAFADWPLMAKLTNWGIAFHMGLLFGLPNQLLLLVAMIGLIVVIVFGYLMWWRRRPTRGSRFALGRAPRRGALRGTSPWLALPVLAAALVVGWFVPLVGLSLLAFLAVDVAIGLVGRLRATAS
ncbi:PepSY-associated TM helix domain-containing protein [Nocardia amikacinitolerans]|uniref:PepSY-associated TM helix domain-containing protein n=1 Tax=Nocardia amikacinitolerans TaxID=756689 RepID=UPI0020A3AEB6|nr:PepSY-associated TM helix domain-containing protein [Nocardia amikacinitolerans]MCP2274667.1 putative iron-regulated membrane protein [Nocardia amikacinitolerans]